MYETSYNGIRYCFYDDHLTLNDKILRYELMNNIQHRGGDKPAFVFDYSGKRFAMPYPPEELANILPYMKTASDTQPDPEPVELVTPENIPSEPIVAEPVYNVHEPEATRSGSQVPPATKPLVKKSKKKGCLIGAIILVLLLIALFACVGGGDTDDATEPDATLETEVITETEPTTSSGAPADFSTEERNAYETGITYLSTLGLSRSGLIEQLKYEQFPEETCEKAVSAIEANGEVDWNEECLECANNYMSTMTFSKEELKEQLRYEGFTDDQINAIIDEAYQ